ncbi:hypothetical protein GGF32_001415 [Allomyces javanicus]|nr:hypothetical protein GGF32_001415 [Allomyces javanicus]
MVMLTTDQQRRVPAAACIDSLKVSVDEDVANLAHHMLLTAGLCMLLTHIVTQFPNLATFGGSSRPLPGSALATALLTIKSRDPIPAFLALTHLTATQAITAALAANNAVPRLTHVEFLHDLGMPLVESLPTTVRNVNAELLHPRLESTKPFSIDVRGMPGVDDTVFHALTVAMTDLKRHTKSPLTGKIHSVDGSATADEE